MCVTSRSTPFIKPVLDAGADGIIVPHANFALKMARCGVQWLQVGDDCGYLILAMDPITTAVRSQF